MPIQMSISRTFVLFGALLAAAVSFSANAAPKTVCTITVNSPDERESFRRHLPAGDYKFVELVERGRPDWLASACEQRVQCDALIISGHFDGGTEFYTDRLDQSEYLSVEEMERASCSGSCPGVFSNLKEVYLFGCNTLKPEARQTVTEDIVRGLLRAGHSPTDAARVASILGEQHAGSNRDRMRHIFKDVPVLYGFSSLAPLGRTAGPLLDRYFQSVTSAPEIGTGQVSGKLMAAFSQTALTVTPGLSDTESQATVRREACQFIDNRLTDGQKVAFMHQVLQRDMAEVRMFLGHLERFASSIGPVQRVSAATTAAFATVAGDHATRGRYLEAARDADEASVRMRMMALARSIGWLTPAQEQAELVRTIADHVARDRIGRDEVDMACKQARQEETAPLLHTLAPGALKSAKVASAAAMACLGSSEAHGRVVRALTSANPDDIAMAKSYLRHKPLVDGELRAITAGIAKMPAADAQVRALETLAQQRLADPESLREIARLFPVAKSVHVQRAIASVLIRSDYRVLGRTDLARSLQQYRLKSPDGSDVIDALIRILQAG